MQAPTPFPLSNLDPELEAFRAYWSSLIRGDNKIPFEDTFSPNALASLSSRLLILDVFERPNRFRYNGLVGADVEAAYGNAVRDLFVHETERRAPFDFLESQAEATIESAQPTCYRGTNYARLLLPMWADGRISMLVGAIVWR